MMFRKPVDEASILRFEPRGQDHFLKDPPAKKSIDFAFLKDAAEEYLQGLARINRALGDAGIETAYAELKSAYGNVFGTPLLDATLNEAYQDRVQQVADAVASSFEDKHPSKPELLQAIETQAKWTGVTEYTLGKNNPKSTAWRDFQRDVLAALKGRISFGRPGAKASAEDRKRRQEILLNKIARIIEDSLGYSFPDGDPIDYIMPRVERLGINYYDIINYLDLTAKKVLGSTSFHDYMGNLYDDMLNDNPEVALQSGILHNPYNNKPLDISSIIPQVMEYNPRIAIDAFTDASLAKNPKVIAALQNYKEQTVKTLLKMIKERPTSRYAGDIARNLKAGGIEWPELDTIIQSVGNNKLWEQMKPGDFLILESELQSIVGTIISNDSGSVIVEGEVIYNKFGTKQAQKGKDQYKHNSDVADMIPRYNPVTKQNAPAGHFTGVEEPYDHFEVKKVRDNVAHIMGVTKDGKHIQTSTTNVEVATALTDAFNRGGFSDKDIQRVPLNPQLDEAEYQGRNVELNKPMPGEVKKYKVYVKDPKTGNIKKVNFGDKNMEIKRDDPERRKNFRARHGCGTNRASDKTKAAYWSCRMWSSKPVSKILKGK